MARELKDDGVALIHANWLHLQPANSPTLSLKVFFLIFHLSFFWLQPHNFPHISSLMLAHYSRQRHPWWGGAGPVNVAAAMWRLLQSFKWYPQNSKSENVRDELLEDVGKTLPLFVKVLRAVPPATPLTFTTCTKHTVEPPKKEKKCTL